MLEICSDLFKTSLKIYYFCQHSKKAKKGQMAKPFNFWQTVFKKAKWQPCLETLSKMFFGSKKSCLRARLVSQQIVPLKALFTRDILTHNIAIKRYCDKKILR